MAKRKRNHAEAYRKRIERGLARGLTLQEARGHGGIRKKSKAAKLVPINPTDPLFQGFEAVRKGAAMTPTARRMRISTERLSRFIKANADIERRSGRILIVQDRLISVLPVFTNGRSRKITVYGRQRDWIAQYMTAVETFLKTRDASHLAPYVDVRVKDTRGKSYPLETNPNRLLELESVGELDFIITYKGLAVQ